MTQLLKRLFRRKPVVQLPIIATVTRDVTPEERANLKQWLASPMTQFALGLVAARRPSVYIHASPEPAATLAAESRRLHRLQGYEVCLQTLLLLPKTPEEIKQAVIESYPDENEQ